MVFSETSVYTSDTGQNDETIDIGMTIEPTALPTEIPTALMPLVKTGHQLFWSTADEKLHPYQIHFLYNSKIYFNNKFPNFNAKFRALYFLERMTPVVEGELDSGKGLIVGFSISVDTGQSPRGLGSVSIFDSELVSFIPSA